MVLQFPPVEHADEFGLLAVGGDLDVTSLELAYRSGIFPWPVSANKPVLWFAPPKRAIIEFDSFRIPKRLQRELKKPTFTFEIDRNFETVIKMCASIKNRKKQTGTWITSDMIRAFTDFHQAGFAHSFEIYNNNGTMVGGLYGVLIENYFAGESMFHREKNASKFALIKTIRYLQKRDLAWIDIQTQSPLLASFGAIEIPRAEFMSKLKIALEKS